MAGMEEPPNRDERPQPEQILGVAVEHAYAAFAANRIGPTMVVHRRDVTPAEVAALGAPIRSVPTAAIDRWLPHAITTWGTARDLRALLPRVLELLTAGLLTTPPEALFAKLHQAEADTWPPEEQAALEDVLAALWLTTLARHPSPVGIPAGRLLTSLAELGRSISPYLDDWLLLLTSNAEEGGPARQHLRDLARRVETLRSSGLGVADLFWSPHPAEAARLEEWLASPLTRGELRR
jgi:hypothetical protein